MILALLLPALAAPVPGRVPIGSPHCFGARTTKVLTEDGATIALHHHAGAGHPVLLVHGISSNHYFWDLDEEHSFAAWLADRGHDVWLLDLRGHGDAETDRRGRPQRAGWHVDEYAKYDVPAAIERIRKVTGHDEVAYVGHSMGGMVGAMYLAMGGEHLSSITLVGSPATFTKGVPMSGLAQLGFDVGGATQWWVDTPKVAATAADVGRAIRLPLQEKLYNPENFTPDSIRAMLRRIVSPTSRGEMRQFARMLRDERLESWDRTVDYREQLSDVHVPAFALVGDADQVAAPAWVEAWEGAFGGPYQEFHAGTAEGLVADYGHLDFGLGERASTEIFPRIEAWLLRYPGR